MLDASGQQAVLEALRQRAGMGQPSGAGVQGGMPAMQQASPTNPMAQAGMSLNQPTPNAGALPQAGTAVNPSAGAISAMNKAQPGEAMFIVKALAKRLDQHPVPPPGQ